jgi:hypothetical protein
MHLVTGLGKRKSIKQGSQVQSRIKAICLGRLNDTVKSGTGRCSFICSRKQLILPPDDKRPDGFFRQVVVWGKPAIVNIPLQAIPLSDSYPSSTSQIKNYGVPEELHNAILHLSLLPSYFACQSQKQESAIFRPSGMSAGSQN